MKWDRSPATDVRHVNGSIFRRDLDVAMQSGAVINGVHREGWPEGLAAVEADCGARVGDALRCVINGVRVAAQERRRRVMKTAAAESLVVDVRREAGAFAQDEIIAVVVSNVSRASGWSQAFQLGNKGPAGIVVREENRIARGARRSSELKRFRLPKHIGWR